MEVNEHGKKREVILDGGYEYRETLSNESGNIVTFFSMCKYSDYSFYFVNLNENANTLTIEIDSAFYQAFLVLLEGISELRINSDFSERFVDFKMNEDGEIKVSFHLLEGETDGSVDVKNIMFDLRSQADANDTDIKDRLGKFFSVLSQIMQSELTKENKKREL